MAICEFCQSEMLEADGCVENPIMIGGVVYPPIVYGREIGWGKPKGRCGDCGVKPGRVHHHGCDIESCPKCRRQAISCGCVWAGEDHPSDNWEFDSPTGPLRTGRRAGPPARRGRCRS